MKQNNSLYAISAEYQKVFAELSEMDLDEQTISDSLSLIKDDFDNKAINISSLIKNTESQVNAMKEAEKSIYNRRKALENKIDNFKSYLKTNMEACGITHIHHPYFDIKLCKCRTSLNEPKDIDLSKLPKEYIRETIIKPDKEKIKEALENGISVLTYSLNKDNKSLRIK